MESAEIITKLAEHSTKLEMFEKDIKTLTDAKHAHANVYHQHEGRLYHVEKVFEEHVANIDKTIASLNETLTNLSTTVNASLEKINIFKYKVLGGLTVVMLIAGAIFTAVVEILG